MCLGGPNSPQIDQVIQIYVKAPVWFNGCDIFKIEATTGLAPVAPSSVMSITHAALSTIAPGGDYKKCDIMKGHST